MAVVNIRDIVGKLSRVESGEYRLGIYGNENLLESLKDVEVFDRLSNFGENTTEELKKIGIKIVDLSQEPTDEYGYQCDLVVADFSYEDSTTNQNRINEIINANAPKYENGQMVRQNAPIIAVYDKTKFETNDDIKNFRKDISNKLKTYAPPHFVVGYDNDLGDLSDSIVPALIENDVFDSKAILDLENTNQLETGQLIQRFSQMITYTFDSKNPYTKGHSERVAMLATLAASGMRFSKEEFAENFPDLNFEEVTQKFEKDSNEEGKEMYGFNDKYLDTLGGIATAHDIGKIGIPNSILDKPSQLTDQEFEIMKQHSKIGELFFKYLSNTSDKFKEVSRGIVDHHEKYNGRGYPNGKAGNSISTVGRVIALADAFDAMTTTRSYNNPKDFETAIIDICQNAGTQFDPNVVYGMCRSLCKECTYEIPDKMDLIDNGLITSKESFDFICSKEMLNYNYSTPPLYDKNGHEVKERASNARHDYVPNTNLLKEFSNQFLKDRASFDSFLDRTKSIAQLQDVVMPTRRRLNIKKDEQGLSAEENSQLEKVNKAFQSIIKIKFENYFDKDFIDNKAKEINDILNGNELER